MLFRKNEKQKLLEARTKALKEAESKVENRNRLIGYIQENNKSLKEENLLIYSENKELRFENEEMLDILKRITKLIECNKYNNEKAVLNKINELVADYQSQN